MLNRQGPMRLSSFLLLILLAACNFNTADDLPDLTPNTDNVIFVTATPIPNAASPTSPPPPTLAPTPTVDPGVLLQLGDNYVLNGYLENAMQSYQSILEQGELAPSNLRAAAAFKLGQSAIREGLFDVAVDTLTQVITEFPNDTMVAPAYFLRGDAYLGLSQWSSAIADFRQYVSLRPGLIDSYVNERIADAQLALGETDAAYDSYQLALSANRTLVPQLILREKVAQVFISAGQTADAVAQYDAILDVARNAPYRASIDFATAQTLINGGDLENGLQRMQRVFNEYQDTPTASRAMSILLTNGIAVDSFVQGQVYFGSGEYQAAIDAFNDYSTTHELAAIPAELHLLLGRAYREIGNSDAAVIAFQTIIDQYPQDPLFGDALLEQGRTRFLANDIPGAIQTYLAIAENYAYLPDAASEALWRAGYLYGTNGDPVLSRQIFTQLADTYPNAELTANGLFLAASVAVTAEEWAIAENLYSRLATVSTGGRPIRSLFMGCSPRATTR